MGCWNATCNISNLPIFVGDDVVVGIIKPSNICTEFSGSDFCYPNEMWNIMPLFIEGIYNDYGGIENYKEEEMTKIKDIVLQNSIVLKDSFTTLETHNIIDCIERSLVFEFDNRKNENKGLMLSIIMFHKEIFDKLVKKENKEYTKINGTLNYLDKPWKEDEIVAKYGLDNLNLAYNLYWLYADARRIVSPQSGAGSQNSNIKTQMEIAEATLIKGEEIEERLEAYLEMEEDEYEE